MKRIVLVVTVALVMGLMMALSGPAWATIHPLANMECSNENASAVTQNQTPPGLTPGGPDQSKATVAQPVIAVSGGDPFADPSPSPAFKTFGANIEGEYCPANR
jgi:hypothetical protein